MMYFIRSFLKKVHIIIIIIIIIIIARIQQYK